MHPLDLTKDPEPRGTRRRLTLAVLLVIVPSVAAILLASLARPSLRISEVQRATEGDRTNQRARFVLTNASAVPYITFGRNGRERLYCFYRDTMQSGRTNWFDDYVAGERQWIVDVDPHSAVTFSVALPAPGITREFAVMFARKPKDRHSLVDRAVMIYERFIPRRTPRVWYTGVLTAQER